LIWFHCSSPNGSFESQTIVDGQMTAWELVNGVRGALPHLLRHQADLLSLIWVTLVKKAVDVTPIIWAESEAEFELFERISTASNG
jgi:hypothetical protein